MIYLYIILGAFIVWCAGMCLLKPTVLELLEQEQKQESYVKAREERINKEIQEKQYILDALKSMIEDGRYKGYIRIFWSRSLYGGKIEFAEGCSIEFPKILDSYGRKSLHIRYYGTFTSKNDGDFLYAVEQLIYSKPCLYKLDMDGYYDSDFSQKSNKYEEIKKSLPVFSNTKQESKKNRYTVEELKHYGGFFKYKDKILRTVEACFDSEDYDKPDYICIDCFNNHYRVNLVDVQDKDVASVGFSRCVCMKIDYVKIHRKMQELYDKEIQKDMKE